MRRLWIQLTLAFGLTTAIAVLVVALLTNWRTGNDFRGFLAQNQVQDSGLINQLGSYYAANQSWEGVAVIFRNTHGRPDEQFGTGPGHQGGQGLMRSDLSLADTEGRIVYTNTAAASGRLPTIALETALPIYNDTTIVGYLSIQAPNSTVLPIAAQRFLDQVNRSLLEAGLLAGVLGVLIGLILARGLSAPLARLADAAHAIAQGDLQRRVTPSGPTEVADVAASFNNMADSLAQAEELRRQLVADIAHELRTPLSVIQGNLRAILDDIYPLEKAEITTIYDETILLHRLIEDLRQLALADAGRLSLHLHHLAPAEMLAKSAEVFTAAATAKAITLTSDFPANLPTVLADPDRSGQILHNLLANALRHTPEHGRIHMSAASDGTSVIFTVRDSGSGIAPEDLPHVFERFWRADRSRSRMHGGSGLGLAITRRLVEAHGGRIGVESTPGRGASFWFTLPIVGD